MALGLAPAPLARKRQPERQPRRLRWPIFVGFGVIAVAALAVTALLEWSGAKLATDPSALARVEIETFGGTLEQTSATDSEGRTIALTEAGGKLTPVKKIAPGAKLTIELVTRRPGWNAWLLGKTEKQRLTLVTPYAEVTSQWVTKPDGGAVPVTFSEPVARVSYAGHTTKGTGKSLNLPEKAKAGTVKVAVAARSWEKLAPATTVHYFPEAKRPVALVSPTPGGRLDPGDQLRLTLSEPISKALGKSLPKLDVAGHWKRTTGHTLVFTPSGAGPALGATVKVTLPHTVALADVSGRGLKTGREITWQVPPASPLRLIELLAEDGYLPVEFKTKGPAVAHTVRAQSSAAGHPPDGTFEWRYSNTPKELKDQWTPEIGNVIVRGAIMMYQNEHQMTVDGLPGPQLWSGLLKSAVDDKVEHAGYSYVYVHRDHLPQMLTLWHNGKNIVKTPGNTGVPAAPTELGTWPVFEHLAETTMTGTNPDGSHYNDPGIKDVSYFNGGDALHQFDRASYGTPQSVGCVELPAAAAHEIWPYTPIGTLVTIES